MESSKTAKKFKEVGDQKPNLKKKKTCIGTSVRILAGK